MANLVLVHGAWGGAWGFHKLRRPLAAAGHQVFTPSLTGIGDRQHLTSPEVGLGTHITDLVNLVTFEDLDPIVLLGFSYGGMVVTGALAEIGDRVSDLIFLDALVPDDGDSAESLIGVEASTMAGASGWLIPANPRDLLTPEETEWSQSRRSPQPIRTFTESVSLAAPLVDRSFSLTYIKATADPDEGESSAFWRAAEVAQASDRWRYEEIAT
ncbi:MAG: alpha/beta fold hydrolase, partial [Actinomycetota bacterium]